MGGIKIEGPPYMSMVQEVSVAYERVSPSPYPIVEDIITSDNGNNMENNTNILCIIITYSFLPMVK